MTTTSFDRRMKKLKQRMEKLKIRYTKIQRKGGPNKKVVGNKLVRIKVRMERVAKKMKLLVAKARGQKVKAPIKKKKLPVSKVWKSHFKKPTAKSSHGSTSPKMAAVTSLQDLWTRSRTDERYEELILAAASNLGGKWLDKGSVQIAFDWLRTNANETSEEGVIEEVNFVRDIVEEKFSKQKAPKAQKIPGGFTAEEFKEIEQAANRTFNYVASDFFSMLQEEGKSSAKQADVIEIVLDANRMSSHGGLSRELEERLYALDMKAQNKVMKAIFPEKRYS